MDKINKVSEEGKSKILAFLEVAAVHVENDFGHMSYGYQLEYARLMIEIEILASARARDIDCGTCWMNDTFHGCKLTSEECQRFTNMQYEAKHACAESEG